MLPRCSKLASANGSTWFRIPPALSSVLAALGTLQLRAVGILNYVDPLVSSSNYYIGVCAAGTAAAAPMLSPPKTKYVHVGVQ